ncbi:MAG TPA: hypothetical protein VIV65_07285 [Gemmatimonadaceae bacterium]
MPKPCTTRVCVDLRVDLIHAWKGAQNARAGGESRHRLRAHAPGPTSGIVKREFPASRWKSGYIEHVKSLDVARLGLATWKVFQQFGRRTAPWGCHETNLGGIEPHERPKQRMDDTHPA